MMDLAKILASPATPVSDVVTQIDAGRKGAAVVVDEERRLVGVVTDGDVRRALLARVDFSLPVQVLLDRRPRDLYPEPVSAQADSTRTERLAVMRARSVRHLPILDADHRVVGFDCLDELIEPTLDVSALVMAGGFGHRMRPLTDRLPKGLLPIGTKPVLEHLLSHLAAAGIRHLTIATHYRGDQIREYFGDGSRLGVAVQYVQESEPLGTAGALRLVPPDGRPLLVVNGDLLTRVDVASMMHFHREHHADLTVGLRAFEMQVPYGVVEVDGSRVLAVREKPIAQHFVNAGIYLVEPGALGLLPDHARVDMPDFIERLASGGRTVVGFPIREYWLDIGLPTQYAQAQVDAAEGRF